MKIKVDLRHFGSGNVDHKQIEADMMKRFSFLEDFVSEDIPVKVKIKYKGKQTRLGFIKRPLAFQVIMRIKLVSGEDLTYSVRGKDYDDAMSKLKKTVKENVAQTKERRDDRKAYLRRKAEAKTLSNIYIEESLELD